MKTEFYFLNRQPIKKPKQKKNPKQIRKEVSPLRGKHAPSINIRYSFLLAACVSLFLSHNITTLSSDQTFTNILIFIGKNRTSLQKQIVLQVGRDITSFIPVGHM